MPFVPALGQSDFRALREAGAGYVDKTGFIRQLLADPTQVTLFPRPRRFGKTLNLSSLAYFLERRDEISLRSSRTSPCGKTLRPALTSSSTLSYF